MATQKEIKNLADDAEKIRTDTHRSLNDAIWAALDRRNVILNAHLRGDIYRLVRKECDRRKNPILKAKRISDLADSAIKACVERKITLRAAIWVAIVQGKLMGNYETRSDIHDLVKKELDLRKVSRTQAKTRKNKRREYLQQHQAQLF